MRLAVVPREQGHDLRAARHGAGEHHHVRAGRRVAVVHLHHRAVGVDGERVVQARDGTLVVLPAAVEDAPVAQHGRVEVVEHVEAELADLRADADAEFRAAVGREVRLEGPHVPAQEQLHAVQRSGYLREHLFFDTLILFDQIN